jgi:hypothetical protein
LQQIDRAKLLEFISENEGIDSPYGKVTFKKNKDSQVIDWKELAAELERQLDSDLVDMFRKKHTTTKTGSRVFRLPKLI